MERDYRFDYGKGILIFLVILGHFIGDFRLEQFNTYSRLTYNLIYFFHMPVFIFITGYFYRPGRERRVATLLIVYLIWQFANGVLNQYFDDGSFLTWRLEVFFPIFNPEWTMWYLLCVVLWFMITPYFLTLRNPIVIAFFISVLSGALPQIENAFSFRRLLGFYIFFILGYFASQRKFFHTNSVALERLKKWRWVIVIGTLTIIAMATFGGLDAARYFMKYSYRELHFSYPIGTLAQIISVSMQILFCFAFILVLPNKSDSFFSRCGQWTLYLYLTHTLVVRLFKHFWGEVGEHDIWLLIIGVSGSLAFMYIFVYFKLYRIFRPFIQPKLNWLFKK